MDEEPDAIDFNKLSIEERIQHKNWKARVSGYEHLAQLLSTEDDEKSSEFTKYLPLLKKAPVDGNVTVQEKGLGAVYALVEYSHPSISGRIASDVLSGLLVKSQLSSRAKTKELVLDIVLMLVEVEKMELVMEELLKALENKSPKVVSGTINLLKECISQFGNKKFKLGPLVKILPNLFEHKDKNIRTGTKLLTIELYRWFKDALKPMLTGLKPIQLTELEEEFAKVKEEKAVPTRFIRSEQNRVDPIIPIEGDNPNSNQLSGSAMIQEKEEDPFDFLEPVEILSKLPGDFYNQLEAKKWQERKAAIETLQQILSEAPKLASGEYGELVKALKKLVSKDANVVVVANAAKVLAGLASKLRKNFNPYAHSCVSMILDKFKEKKQSVVVPLRESIDAIMLSFNIEPIQENLTTALENKNPQIKSETAQFLSRYAATPNAAQLAGNKKLLKPIITSLVKVLSDMDAAVRDSSAEAIGTIMKVVGEKLLTPLLADVDQLKMSKVKEYHDKAEVKYISPHFPAKPKGGSAKSRAIGGRGQAAAKKTNGHASSDGSIEDLTQYKTNVPSGPSKTKSSSKIVVKESKAVPKGGLKKGASSAPNLKSKAKSGINVGKKDEKEKEGPSSDSGSSMLPTLPLNGMKMDRFQDEKALRVLKWNFTTPREEFYLQLREQMEQANWNSNLITNCFHSDFKYHLKAVDSLTEFLKKGNEEATVANSDILLKWFALRFFDTNPSVILKSLEYLCLLFENYKTTETQLTESEATSFIPYLIQKTGDPKDIIRAKVHEILSQLRNLYSPNKLFAALLNGLGTKNARQRSTCLEELSLLIKDLGMSVCTPSANSALKEISKQIGDKDSAVRNGALNAIVQAYFLEGEKIYKFLGHLSNKDMCMLEERIKRASRNRPPPAPALLPTSTTTTSVPKIAQKAQLTRPTPQKKVPPQHQQPLPPQQQCEYEDGEEQVLTPEPNLNRNLRKQIHTGTITKQKPKQGPLTLDIQGIEEMFRKNDVTSSPRHYQQQHSQNYLPQTAEELLRLPDVELPPKRRSLSGSSPAKSSGQKSSPNSSSGSKADRAVNGVMAQLTSSEIPVAMEALAQIREVVIRPGKGEEYLTEKVDQLLILCNVQYRLILTKHMGDRNLSQDKLVDLYKLLTSVVDSVFKHPVLKKKAGRDVLKELISLIVTILLDQRVARLEEGQNIIRTINVLATCVITSGDATAMLSALIVLLHESLEGMASPPKFIEMIMKCIWKMTRLMDRFMDELDLDRLLSHINNFFQTFPPEFWKEPGRSDVPLRTIKTVVFLMVKHERKGIFKHLTLIPNPESSELYSYLQRALKQVLKEDPGDQSSFKGNGINSGQPSPTVENSKEVHQPLPSPLSSLSKEDQSKLSEIIAMLGTTRTQEGLFELNEFCELRPSFHLDNYLKKTNSEFFYSFVINGIKQIRADRERHEISMTPRLSSRRQPVSDVNPLTPDLSPQGLPGSLPKLPPPEAMTPDDALKWFRASMALAGKEYEAKCDDPEFMQRMRSRGDEEYTGDPEKDLIIALKRAQEFQEKAKQFNLLFSKK